MNDAVEFNAFGTPMQDALLDALELSFIWYEPTTSGLGIMFEDPIA